MYSFLLPQILYAFPSVVNEGCRQLAALNAQYRRNGQNKLRSHVEAMKTGTAGVSSVPL
jgi:hypothetical protein